MVKRRTDNTMVKRNRTNNDPQNTTLNYHMGFVLLDL